MGRECCIQKSSELGAVPMSVRKQGNLKGMNEGELSRRDFFWRLKHSRQWIVFFWWRGFWRYGESFGESGVQPEIEDKGIEIEEALQEDGQEWQHANRSSKQTRTEIDCQNPKGSGSARQERHSCLKFSYANAPSCLYWRLGIFRSGSNDRIIYLYIYIDIYISHNENKSSFIQFS